MITWRYEHMTRRAQAHDVPITAIHMAEQETLVVTVFEGDPRVVETPAFSTLRNGSPSYWYEEDE